MYRVGLGTHLRTSSSKQTGRCFGATASQHSHDDDTGGAAVHRDSRTWHTDSQSASLGRLAHLSTGSRYNHNYHKRIFCLCISVSSGLSIPLCPTLPHSLCLYCVCLCRCLSVCLSLSVCLEGVGWGEWTEINSPNNSNPETSEPHIPELDDPVTEQNFVKP